jgi:hypothetical protein
MRALIILAVLATPALAKMRPPDDSALSPSEVAAVMRTRQPAVAAFEKIVFPKSNGPTTINYPFNSSPA